MTAPSAYYEFATFDDWLYFLDNLDYCAGYARMILRAWQGGAP